MSLSAVKFSGYNRVNKIVVASALEDAFSENDIVLAEERDAIKRHVIVENRILRQILDLAVVYYVGNAEEIERYLGDFVVTEWEVEASQNYWGQYFAGQPLADSLHSSEWFCQLSNADRRSVGQAMSQLCDLPVGWLRACIYARTRGVEVEAPTIGWRFTREDVAA